MRSSESVERMSGLVRVRSDKLVERMSGLVRVRSDKPVERMSGLVLVRSGYQWSASMAWRVCAQRYVSGAHVWPGACAQR